MKLKKINTVFFVVLTMALMTVNVFAEMNTQAEVNNGPMDIRERIGDDSINILKSSTLKFYEEGIEVDHPTINSKLRFLVEIGLGEDYKGLLKAGDYFEFKLPDNLVITEEIKDNLSNYGYFVIDTNSVGRIVFNENIELNSKITGGFYFDSFLNKDSFEEPGQYEVQMPFEKDSIFDLFIKPNGKPTAIEKEVRLDKDRNPSNAIWDVTINKTYESLDNAVVEDFMPDGLTTELIEIFEMKTDHDGNVISKDVPVSSDEYTIDNNKVIFKNTITKPYLVRYTTKINDDIKPNDGGNLEFRNKATLSATGLKGIDAGAHVVATYGKLLHKNRPTYDSIDQIFTWNIEYNYGEKSIENAMLLDTFDEQLEFIEESFTIKSSTNEIVDVKYKLVQEGNTVKIIFEEPINNAYNISYQTKVKDGVLITENQSFNNKVVTEDKSSESSGTAVPRLIEKYAGAVNYADKKIPWTIRINNNNYKMSNYTITDTYASGGLTMDQDTFKIINVDKNMPLDAKDYNLEITMADGKETGFIVKLLNDYEKTSDRFAIVFETFYEVNDLFEKDSNVFRNQVQLKWTDIYGNEHHNDGEGYSEVNTFTIHNGRKIGSYNAVTKEITWQVDVNYNSEIIDAGKITDKIEDTQTYIDDSLEIYSYVVLENGEIRREEQLDLNEFDIDYPSELNENTLTVNLPEESIVKYSIQFRTSVESDVIQKTYNNLVTFSNGTFTRNLQAYVSVTNGNKFISKSGNQNKDIADWQIFVNESQSTIKDAEIHDFPSSGQILLEDTFKLFPVIVEENEDYGIDYDNPLEKGVDYELSIINDSDAKQSFILKFKKTIDRTYVLNYASQISLSPDSTEISNRVKFKGNQVTYETEEGPTRIVVNVNETGGFAVGEKGNLKIRKVDPQGRPLSGVKFELYNRLNRKVYTKETDDNGEIDFNNLLYSDYTLYETKSLKGYVIPEELYSGMQVVVDEQTTQDEYVLLLENKMNELIINKRDADGNALEGARFELIKVEEIPVVIAGDFTVEEAGKVFYGLEAGQYELRERFAPKGYIINEEVISFEIERDRNAQELDLSLDIINYKGSVSLTKVDASNNVLEGVVYELYNSDDERVKDGLVTDEFGQIHFDNELSPGDYYFKEVQSVQGHIVNETPLHFSIVSKSVGKPERILLTATNFKGSVQFEKRSENDHPLKGVEFELFNKNHELMTSVFSNHEGIVRVDQLEPGDYYFKEKTPLEGFIKNTEVIDFVIPEKSNQEKVLIELDDFINYRGSLKVQKVDETGALLKEAKFILLDENNTVVKKFETIDGEYLLTNLKPNTYTLLEQEAPKGYVLSEEAIEVSIVDEFEGSYEAQLIQVVNVEEEPLEPYNPQKPGSPSKPEKPKETVKDNSAKDPKTGLKENAVVFLNVILIGTLVLLILNNKKKRKI